MSTYKRNGHHITIGTPSPLSPDFVAAKDSRRGGKTQALIDDALKEQRLAIASELRKQAYTEKMFDDVSRMMLDHAADIAEHFGETK